MRAAWPSCIIHLDSIVLTVLGQEYIFHSSWWASLSPSNLRSPADRYIIAEPHNCASKTCLNIMYKLPGVLGVIFMRELDLSRRTKPVAEMTGFQAVRHSVIRESSRVLRIAHVPASFHNLTLNSNVNFPLYRRIPCLLTFGKLVTWLPFVFLLRPNRLWSRWLPEFFCGVKAAGAWS
jgi:hypothetical protein